MSAAKTFEDYLTSQVPEIDTGNFLVNLFLTGLLASVLAWSYSKFARSQANRAAFAANFLLTAMTTMLVISVVKSSLALSLGLVGALSIVRFRTAIKDPEELAFLFISISLGLGFGADQRKITLIGFTVIILAYVLLRLKYFKNQHRTVMHLILSSRQKLDVPLSAVSDLIMKFTQRCSLKRVCESSEVSELSFLLEFSNIEGVHDLKTALKKDYPQYDFSLIEYQGIVE